MFSAALAKVRSGETLSAAESEAAIGALLRGGVADERIGEFLKHLHLRGETEDEVLGAARGLRARMNVFEGAADALDVCGTGGDNHGTYNVSSAVAFVLAGGGVKVAKHGNRAVSSKSGSSDFLSVLGIKIDASADAMRKSLEEANICFLMAPLYHPAIKNVMKARAALGHRSIFNLLGPLANPAKVKRQLVGVYDAKWLAPFAAILGALGSEAAWIAHGADGLDEITTTGTTHLCKLANGVVANAQITPEEVGLAPVKLDALKGGNTQHNTAKFKLLLDGERGAYRDIVCLNAAAGFVIAGKAETLQEGLALAAQALDSGNAKIALEKFVRISNG